MATFDLVPDCGRCAALCCVATHFDASEDFALTKGAGIRCPMLTKDHRCDIHSELIERGFSGCAIYSCYGAGQRITRMATTSAEERNAAFLNLRGLHELIWLLTEAKKRVPAALVVLAGRLENALDALGQLANQSPAELADLDDSAVRARGRSLLREVGRALAELGRNA
jgi:hypothetical protein